VLCAGREPRAHDRIGDNGVARQLGARDRVRGNALVDVGSSGRLLSRRRNRPTRRGADDRTRRVALARRRFLGLHGWSRLRTSPASAPSDFGSSDLLGWVAT